MISDQKISIIGSTGFVGMALLRKALENGYQVKTLVRNPEKLGIFKNQVEFVQGDIFQKDKVYECVYGTEAVISTVPPEANTKEPEKYARAMHDLTDVLEKNGIKRFILIGGAVVDGGTNENWNAGRRFLRLFLNLVWKQGLIAKKMEWEVLKKSNLDWTLIRPPRILKGKSKNKLLANEFKLARPVVHLDDLTDFILKQINSTDWIKKAPLVASGL